jgi:acyl carrier protein
MCSHTQDTLNSEIFVEERKADNSTADDDIDIQSNNDEENLDSIDNIQIVDSLQNCP